MRISALALFLLFVITPPATASRHVVKVQVLSTLNQHVSGVGVGIGPATGAAIPPGGEGASITVCPLPYPDGSHNLERCQIQGPSGDEIGSVQNRRVQAILTTDNGQTYYAVLGCQKQYGWCVSLADHADYVGNLDDNSKWLEDYQHRPGTGFMKLSLRPDGKKKATYQIEYAVRVKFVGGTVEK